MKQTPQHWCASLLSTTIIKFEAAEKASLFGKHVTQTTSLSHFKFLVHGNYETQHTTDGKGSLRGYCGLLGNAKERSDSLRNKKKVLHVCAIIFIDIYKIMKCKWS